MTGLKATHHALHRRARLPGPAPLCDRLVEFLGAAPVVGPLPGGAWWAVGGLDATPGGAPAPPTHAVRHVALYLCPACDLVLYLSPARPDAYRFSTAFKPGRGG